MTDRLRIGRIGAILTVVLVAVLPARTSAAPTLAISNTLLVMTQPQGSFRSAPPESVFALQHDHVRLFTEQPTYALPSVSPDGKLIALGSSPGVFVVKRDGTHSHFFLDDSNRCVALTGDDIAWEPHGRGIAYVADLESDALPRCLFSVVGIYVDAPGTGGTRKLTSGDFRCCDYSWSADGRHLVVSGSFRHAPAIALVNIVTGSWRLLVKDAAEGTVNPVTGALAYVVARDFNLQHRPPLRMADRDGAHARSLATTHDSRVNPIWSPNGRTLAYLTCGPATSRHPHPAMSLRVVAVAHGHQRILVNSDGPLWSPAWSPDGRSIAYIAGPLQGDFGTTVRLVDVASGKSRVLLHASARGPKLLRNDIFSGLSWLSPRLPQPHRSSSQCPGAT